MADGHETHGGGFSIGDTSRRFTAEDLARLEEELDRCEARLRESLENVDAPLAALDDSWSRTLPEHLASSERAHREDQAACEEAQSLLRASELALDEARRGSGHDLGALAQQHRDAQARLVKAQRRVELRWRLVEKDRAGLPEDETAEARARVAFAHVLVSVARGAVDHARADLLPERCRDAHELLAGHAADEWLYRNGPADPKRREFIRPQIVMNIRVQLATTMFRPDLEGLDRTINITGDPEPRSAPDARAPGDGSGGANRLADTLNRLRFGPGE